MSSMVNELPGGTPGEGGPDSSALSELRERVKDIAGDLSKVAAQRARDAQEAAEAGADALRATIRRQPALSVGVAALAGALLAAAVIPRAKRRSESRWRDWAPSLPVGRADLHEFADGLQRSLSRATSSVPLSSSLERLVDAVTRVEPGSALNGTIEKASSWLRNLQSRAAKAPKQAE